MIVVERDFLARWIRELKQRQNSASTDYMTGYISAMSTVEGMLAVMPEYDLDKLFSPGDVCKAMVLHGQRDTRFKLGGDDPIFARRGTRHTAGRATGRDISII